MPGKCQGRVKKGGKIRERKEGKEKEKERRNGRIKEREKREREKENRGRKGEVEDDVFVWESPEKERKERKG